MDGMEQKLVDQWLEDRSGCNDTQRDPELEAWRQLDDELAMEKKSMKMTKAEMFEKTIGSFIDAKEPYIYVNWISAPVRSREQVDRITDRLYAAGYKTEHDKYDGHGEYLHWPQEEWLLPTA